MLFKNSKTPSDPTNNILSYYERLCYDISGSHITPTDEPTKSPKLLLIAKPGYIYSLTHTLAGPIKLFDESLNASTLPPLDKILAFS